MKTALAALLAFLCIGNLDVRRYDDPPRPALRAQEPVISPDCVVIVDGVPGTLADIKEGMEAVVTVEHGMVVRIRATTPKGK